MSTRFRPIQLVLVAFGLILQFFTFTSGQDVDATIKIDATNQSFAHVEGRFLKPERPNRRNLSFLLSYAGVPNLADRIKSLKAKDSNGHILSLAQFNAGEYLASPGDIAAFSYEITLTPLIPASATAHISWINSEQGLLMADDVLPLVGANSSAKLTFELPLGWSVTSVERQLSTNVFSIENIEKAVFVIGKNWRVNARKGAGHSIDVSLSGEWKFSDPEVGEMGGSIVDSYAKTFGDVPSPRSQIVMFRMPADVPFGRWEAETRGSAVVITSSDMPFDTQSKQRLHEQLRHEMFHLWIPNGVNLSGNYDWFYEGFALYQSLRMGVATNRIRFDDLLDTLSRAITTDRLHSNGVSLIDATKNRFVGGNTTVYARGMVVAFLCDLAMLERSKGKRSVENILREVYQKHHSSPARTDGTEAVLAAFSAYPELKPIIDRYIKGSEKVATDEYFGYAGIEAQMQNPTVTLKVLPKPNSRQKDLLDKLGYNTWRKLANISK